MDSSDDEGEILPERLTDSSDEEGEILPEYVDEYYFVDQQGSPITFAALPVRWKEQDSTGNSGDSVFLRGKTDGGNQLVFKRVTAWKFHLSYAQPEISVLVKQKTWVMLQKPRKSYVNNIRKMLVTLHCLHFVKWNPEASASHVWNSLPKIVGVYHIIGVNSVRPSEQDLSDHVSLIGEAVKRDGGLLKSKYLLTFLGKTSEAISIKGESSLHNQQDAQSPRECELTVDREAEEENSSENDYEMNLQFDPVCSICDNGGEVLCCDGSCLRSFHATLADGTDSACKSLGFTKSGVEAIATFLCDNCLFKQHQCYACGELGSSDESSSQEVFPCSAANCGHFYHPRCIADLLHANDTSRSEELQAKIAMRESFYCSLHKCYVCKFSENKSQHELHFAICRRCPKAYHRKCLPRKIAFEHSVENGLQRAWEGLLFYNRILLYCLDHEMDPQLLTPRRDHLIFPYVDGKRRTQNQRAPSTEDNITTLTRKITSSNSSKATSGVKYPKRAQTAYDTIGIGAASNKLEKRLRRDDSDDHKKQGVDDVGRQLLQEKGAPASIVIAVPAAGFKFPRIARTTTKNISRSNASKLVEKKIHPPQPTVDPDIELRVMKIIEEVDSSFSFEEFMKSQEVSHVKSYRSGYGISKNITMGLVQTHTNAARAALKMFQEGRGEDAKAIFGPEILIDLMKYKKKLEVYLAPFLHGMRYTSFGRHFTKQEKLVKIVERLHWYVQSGDMVVDFCCGSNDFSCLMKEKLETTGKSCLFKNFDLFPPKNDFNFEMRDWMSVNVDELPDGSQLIIGLNPPFGYKASLANNFIREALKFKPKLLILIVPSETKRVNERAAYDLIWEDTVIVSGMSFYLPGSIDVNDNTIEQWNVIPPLLYLWSRHDWTARHKAIALQHGHITEVDRSAYNNYYHHVRNPAFTNDGVSKSFYGLPETTYQDPGLIGGNICSGVNMETVHIPGAASEDYDDDNMCVDMDISPITSPAH